VEEVVRNVVIFYNKSGVDTIKLGRGKEKVYQEIRAIVNVGMSVIGHIGLSLRACRAWWV